MSPTVLRRGPYRLFFYSNEADEPRHVHVEREDRSAKFWLDPVRLARSRGLSVAELARLHRLVSENAGLIREAWDEHFGA